MTRYVVILSFVLLSLVPVASQAATVAGTYHSKEGAITLSQNGDRVSGSYTNDNGEMIGLMFDNILEGFWIEDGSDRRCATPKHGRYHWGRITFTFTGSGFSGQWGYCNDAPTRPWNGTRVAAGGHGAAAPVDNGFDPLHGLDDGLNLDGLWGSSEGDIRFRQQGNRVAGRYAKDNGEIQGSLRRETLHGYWIEDHSAQQCAVPKNGRYYWGRVEFRFSGSAFSGRWGYCDGPLTGEWRGERK